MSKKLISGALATMMAVSALSTGMVFADEVAPTDQMDNRPTAEEKAEMRENAEEHIQGIIDEYYPEIKDEWTQTAASIESLNTEIRDYMKAKIEGRKDSLQEMREAREEKVKMAKEERDEKAADRDAKQAERTEKKEERDTKQAEQAAKVEEKQAQVEERKEDRSQAVAEKKEQRSATKESLVEAVEAGDTEAVKEILDSMLAAMQNHLTLMTERFDQMMAKDTASEPMDEPETEPVTE
tara:strand:- start:287 stop:1003 length:717 start_codon:yes stop_codon:yes gene_type:complete